MANRFGMVVRLRILVLLSAVALLSAAPAAPQVVPPSSALLNRLSHSYDPANGGFGQTPKFIPPLEIRFLLLEGARGNQQAREMALSTLRAMAHGAIHDQAGGGFHHVSIDSGWRIPKFEKRLVDQPLMAIAYTEAWQLTHEDEYQRVARRTLDYVLRDLSEKNGAFDAGQGASSLMAVGGGPQIVVGRVYGWDINEAKRLLWKDADLFVYYYGLKVQGNVPAAVDPEGTFKGVNLLSAVRTDSETRARFGLTQTELTAALDRGLAKLQLVRSKRPQPERDPAVLTAPNALMVSALARAGTAFDEPHYTYAAGQTARFLEARLYEPKSGKLRHAFADPALGDALDYSTVVQAFLDTYQATLNPRWLKLAIDLQQQQDERFWDGARSRYTSADAAANGVPSANAIAAANLLRLVGLTSSGPWQVKAAGIFRGYADALASAPEQYPDLIAVQRAGDFSVRTVVIIGNPAVNEAVPFLRNARGAFDPPREVVIANGKGSDDPLATWVPAVAQLKGSNHVTATVCRGRSCRTPTDDAQKVAAWLIAPGDE